MMRSVGSKIGGRRSEVGSRGMGRRRRRRRRRDDAALDLMRDEKWKSPRRGRLRRGRWWRRRNEQLPLNLLRAMEVK